MIQLNVNGLRSGYNLKQGFISNKKKLTDGSIKLYDKTSIVDYLKSKGQDASFGARRKLYEGLGLGNRLGDFVGSPQQNTALLKTIQAQEQEQVQNQKAQQNIEQIQDNTMEDARTQEERGFTNVVNYLSNRLGREPNAAELAEYFRPKTEEERSGLPADFMTAQQALQRNIEQGKVQVAGQTPKQDVAATPAADVLSKIMGTPEMDLAEESAQLARKNVERGLESEKQGIQKQFEQRGIPSAGLREPEFEAAETEAAAKQLGISQDLAGIVLRAIREDQEAQAKQAEEESKAQTEALKSAGYISIGGKLYPTLEREKYETSQTEEQQPELRQVGQSLIYVYPDGTIQTLYQAPDEPELRNVGNQLIQKQEDGTWKVIYTAPATSTQIANQLAPDTLGDLAKQGYLRRASKSGIGWDFFKNGTPISAQQISQETGVGLDILLEGSTNPEDIKLIKQIKGSSSNISAAFNSF